MCVRACAHVHACVCPPGFSRAEARTPHVQTPQTLNPNTYPPRTYRPLKPITRTPKSHARTHHLVRAEPPDGPRAQHVHAGGLVTEHQVVFDGGGQGVGAGREVCGGGAIGVHPLG